MPNHITNRLTITAKNLDNILVEIKGEGEDSFIDFHKIVPMPEELKGTTSPARIISQAEYDKETARINRGELTEIEKNFGLSRGITENISEDLKKRFGSNNWYDWSLANWGTKWNAYNQHINDNVIEFDTAWSTPFDVMVALSKNTPMQPLKLNMLMKTLVATLVGMCYKMVRFWNLKTLMVTKMEH